MDEEEDKGRTDIEKKKILAILPTNQELQGDIYNVKLYSSDREGVDWLYSGLEGNLAFVVDFQIKTKYLMLFDPTNYEKVFQYELYNGFEKFFEELAPEFRSFEIDTGFIGLQFDNANDAQNFGRTLDKILQMKNIYTKTKTKENSKLQNEKFQAYCKKLKEIFCEGDSKYDENYAEDGTQILKHRNFKVLSNISYNKEKKKFQFGKISDGLKEMFVNYGIKRKDLESDLDFAFSLFKKDRVALFCRHLCPHKHLLWRHHPRLQRFQKREGIFCCFPLASFASSASIRAAIWTISAPYNIARYALQSLDDLLQVRHYHQPPYMLFVLASSDHNLCQEF